MVFGGTARARVEDCHARGILRRAAAVIGVTETPLSAPIADGILTSGEPATADMPCKPHFM